MGCVRRGCAAALVSLTLGVSLCVPRAHAQLLARLLPERTFMPLLLAGPREPVTGASLVFVTESATQFEEMLEGQAALGASLPLLRLAGESPDHALVLGVQGGVFSRFAMEPHERDLISSDWIFAVPIVWMRNGHWLRFRYLHRSSHMGDEYIERFEVERVPFRREDLEVLGLVEVLPGLGLYGGGRWGFSVEPLGSGRLALQGGIQRFGVPLDGSVRLYVAADVEAGEQTDWGLRTNVQFGVWVDRWQGRGLRLAAELLTGSSPQGEFYEQDETFFTLGIYLDL